MQPPKTWKQAEREVCDRFGGTRKPITGRKGPDGAEDVPVFALEIKHGDQCPIKPWRFFDQALQGVEEVGDERVPAIAMHRTGMSYDDTLVAFRISDWPKVVELVLQEYADE